MQEKTVKFKLVADINNLSQLYFLPHIATIFTIVAGAQTASTFFWFSQGRVTGEPQGLPNLESIFVFLIMVPVIVKYRKHRISNVFATGQTFSKLTISSFVLGGLLLAAGVAQPMLSSIASGGQLITAGLLSTLLDRRTQLLFSGTEG